jgi:hypothetical protein
MFNQHEAISNDIIFEIVHVLYKGENKNHELANKISFNHCCPIKKKPD